MADHTTIEWTDATWNPITGCSVVSAGCKNCYAMKLAGTRLQHHPSREGLTQPSAAGPVWNGQVRFNMAWLDQPLRWKRPRRIFVCAHSDLFHEAVPDLWIADVFAVMHAAPWHTFQVLTKRPARMRTLLASSAFRDLVDEAAALHTHTEVAWPLPNAWLGVSAEDQTAANERIPDLLETLAAVHWLSAEPLLGAIDLRAIVPPPPVLPPNIAEVNGVAAIDSLGGSKLSTLGFEYLYRRLDWVVAGGESGRAARPMHPDWARSLRDQCARAGVAFHFKQWGEWVPAQISGAGLLLEVVRIGKKKAGRGLDGRTHDAYPKVPS